VLRFAQVAYLSSNFLILVLRAAKIKSQERQGWNEFLSFLPHNLEEKWDILMDGITQYLAVLQGFEIY
jgi:hypothetical protein